MTTFKLLFTIRVGGLFMKKKNVVFLLLTCLVSFSLTQCNLFNFDNESYDPSKELATYSMPYMEQTDDYINIEENIVIGSSARSRRSIVIPAKNARGEPIVAIGAHAFMFHNKLQTVTFEEGSEVSLIREHAFDGCKALTDITFPETVEIIEDCAFSYCSFSWISIPKNVTFLGENCFYSCTNFSSFKIPPKVTKLSKYLFNRCSNLRKVTVHKDVTEIDEYVFLDCEPECRFFYEGSKEEFNAIKGKENVTATVYYYSETEPEKDANGKYKGHYWHYVLDYEMPYEEDPAFND